MAAVLKGPITIHQVADLVDSTTRAWYRQNRDRRTLKTELAFWEPSAITSQSRELLDRLPAGEINNLYWDIHRMGLLDRLAQYASSFAVAVYACYGGKYEFTTRVFDKTILSNLANGQTFFGPVKEFVITSYGSPPSSFIELRDSNIRQAQKVIDQSVSGAAYHLINDLH